MSAHGSPADCAAVHAALRAGTTGPGALEHAAACPPCAELLADEATLGRALGRDVDAAPDATTQAALTRGVEAALARDDRSALGRLRGLPTWARRLAALLSLAPLVVWHALHFGWRPDLELYPRLRLGVTLGAFALLALRNAWVALRPPHEALERTARAWIFVGLAGLASLVAALWPAPYPMQPGLCWSSEDGMILACFLWGLALGLPLVVTTVVLNRLTTTASLLLSGAAAGLVGCLVQAAQCPHVGVRHLLLGHSAILVALVAAGAGASAARGWLERS